VQREFVKLTPRAAEPLPSDASVGGLRAHQWDGAFEQVPEPLFFSQTPTDLGQPGDLRMTKARGAENQCIEQSGWLKVPATGLYQFALTSDDGSKLWIGDAVKDVVVDNDGLHGAATKIGYAALAEGWHPIRIIWFNRTGSGTLDLEYGLVDGPQQRPGPQALAAN
jgi:alpha-L-fucosidase